MPKGRVRSGFRIITFWLLYRKAIDGECGVAHNHQLKLVLGFYKASLHYPAIMQGQQKERWEELCELAEQEQNPERLMELVVEINRLLEQKEQRLIAARNQQVGSE